MLAQIATQAGCSSPRCSCSSRQGVALTAFVFATPAWDLFQQAASCNSVAAPQSQSLLRLQLP